MKTAEKIHSCGTRLYSYPFRLYVLECAEGEQERIIISVPKKLFKRAVRRNLIRRRIREAFRHMREDYPSVPGKHIMLVYVANVVLDYGAISDGLGSALGKIP
ncbi:MAG TPA: ribonuclease P protein component [Candidatus Coprenecus stercorigallinarum]|nr:ribonuclease P protein component [Candidatus Coprenecus stercorigallinarum]